MNYSQNCSAQKSQIKLISQILLFSVPVEIQTIYIHFELFENYTKEIRNRIVSLSLKMFKWSMKIKVIAPLCFGKPWLNKEADDIS